MYIYSSTGEKNKIRNIKNQDAYESYERKDIKIFAVSDGAGSYLNSSIAAETACIAAVNYWKNNIQYIKKAKMESIAAYTIAVVQYHLAETARIKGHRYKDYCCTLIISMIYQHKGIRKMITLHIGDGRICEINSNKITDVSAPENGSSVYSTFFVNQDNAYNHCRVIKKDCTGEILLCSDGFDLCAKYNDYSREQYLSKITDTQFWNSLFKPDDITIIVA